MRFSVRSVLLGCFVASVFAAAVYYHQQRQHITYLKADPRRYYGELRLEPPLTHHGFSYVLDGGSIETVLTDSNGVELTLSFSPPGEFHGDTHAFIGTREQMWADFFATNGASGTASDYSPQATRIGRGSADAHRIARYMALAMETMKRKYQDANPESEWERWHYREYLRANTVYGDRIRHILTSATPITGRWGPGEPHAPMPDCCD